MINFNKKIKIIGPGLYEGCVGKLHNVHNNTHWITLDDIGLVGFLEERLHEITDEEEASMQKFKDGCIDKDKLFMSMACLVGMASKDPSTKVGAVIVGQDDEVISLGYNGLPRKVQDLDSERYKKPIKYSWMEHAERNAIFNAARIGVSCKGARMYIPFHPCPDCARAIIQSGIKEVILHENIMKLLMNSTTLDEETKLMPSRMMLEEGGVSIRLTDVDIPDIMITANGRSYSNKEL